MKRGAALEAVFKPVRAPTTFEETVERLGTAIRVGLLAPGIQLPPERQLAEELRISRSTLRQALTTLVQSGHLTSARGRTGGTFVADRPPLSEADDDPLGRDAWATLDHRVAVEVGSVILAAERAQTADLDALDELVERMTGASEFEPYRRADIRFHIGVAEAARSPHLVTEMTEVQGADERSDRAHRPPGGGADPLQRPARRARRACCARRDAAARSRSCAATSAAPSTSSPACV